MVSSLLIVRYNNRSVPVIDLHEVQEDGKLYCARCTIHLASSPGRSQSNDFTEIPVKLAVDIHGKVGDGNRFRGPLSGPYTTSVLLLHGGGQTRHSWSATAKVRARTFPADVLGALKDSVSVLRRC